MEYKTTIKVLTEAKDKYEAADIAGEFLRGDITAGAKVRINTSSLARSRTIKAALVIGVVSIASGICLLGNQAGYKIANVKRKPVTSYAIQPPIKTNLADTKNEDFKKVWQKAHEDRINSSAR
ncbi:MAG: hypothetical protein HQ547_01815 [Candidatus Omnitrophica bacterium]|nr:hypothetical protein [Candidatus Omnitrophota bacterium]